MKRLAIAMFWILSVQTCVYGEDLAPAQAGTSARIYTGLYAPYVDDPHGVEAGYDAGLMGSWYEYRGTMEFPLSGFSTSVTSAVLKLTVRSCNLTSDKVYYLYTYDSDGNGAVNGYDFTNYAATALAVLYSNETPAAASTKEIDVTGAFNDAISKGYSYIGFHTLQSPEITPAYARLRLEDAGPSQPIITITRTDEPEILRVAHAVGVVWKSKPGSTYTVEWASSLDTNTWHWADEVPATQTNTTWADMGSTNRSSPVDSTSRVYRVSEKK